jgi:hypothetical protein
MAIIAATIKLRQMVRYGSGGRLSSEIPPRDISPTAPVRMYAIARKSTARADHRPIRRSVAVHESGEMLFMPGVMFGQIPAGRSLEWRAVV